MTFEIITTERLILRSVSDADLETLHSIVFSDPEVMSQAFHGRIFSRRESEDFVDSHFDHDGNGKQPGVLVIGDTGEIAGFAGLLECSALGDRDYEIGFVLARNYWGYGYATEIGLAQIAHGLQVIGCERLLALVSSSNRASAAGAKSMSRRFLPERSRPDGGPQSYRPERHCK